MSLADIIVEEYTGSLPSEREIRDFEDANEVAQRYQKAKTFIIKKGLERFTVEEQKEILSEISYIMDYSMGFQSFVAQKKLTDIVPGISTITNLPDKLKIFFGFEFENIPLLMNNESHYTLHEDIMNRIINWRLLKGK